MEERAERLAQYIIENRTTVRAAAQKFIIELVLRARTLPPCVAGSELVLWDHIVPPCMNLPPRSSYF